MFSRFSWATLEIPCFPERVWTLLRKGQSQKPMVTKSKQTLIDLTLTSSPGPHSRSREIACSQSREFNRRPWFTFIHTQSFSKFLKVRDYSTSLWFSKGRNFNTTIRHFGIIVLVNKIPHGNEILCSKYVTRDSIFILIWNKLRD